MKKRTFNPSGLVYSTNPDLNLQKNEEEVTLLHPSEQKLFVATDKKNRSGKVVTLITGFTGSKTDSEKLAASLRSHCGCGGSVKDGEIIIQGNNTEKVIQWLKKNNYTQVKKI